MKTTLFYFTGTGNSLAVAKDLAAALGNADLIQISKKNWEKIMGVTWSGTVGIIFPVYFGGLPRMVVRFSESLLVEPGTYVFALATFGGVPGVAFEQLGDILARRSIPLPAVFGILMPGNYQVLYQPRSIQQQEEQFAREKEIIKAIARLVATRAEVKRPRPGFLTRSVTPFFYRSLHPATRDRHFHVTEKCTGCGICARICPARNITLRDKRPEWHHQCEYCLACLQWCPVQAIQYEKKTIKRGRYHHPEVRVEELFQE